MRRMIPQKQIDWTKSLSDCINLNKNTNTTEIGNDLKVNGLGTFSDGISNPSAGYGAKLLSDTYGQEVVYIPGPAGLKVVATDSDVYFGWDDNGLPYLKDDADSDYFAHYPIVCTPESSLGIELITNESTVSVLKRAIDILVSLHLPSTGTLTNGRVIARLALDRITVPFSYNQKITTNNGPFSIYVDANDKEVRIACGAEIVASGQTVNIGVSVPAIY